jgi:hypothetical protein
MLTLMPRWASVTWTSVGFAPVENAFPIPSVVLLHIMTPSAARSPSLEANVLETQMLYLVQCDTVDLFRGI